MGWLSCDLSALCAQRTGGTLARVKILALLVLAACSSSAAPLVPDGAVHDGPTPTPRDAPLAVPDAPDADAPVDATPADAPAPTGRSCTARVQISTNAVEVHADFTCPEGETADAEIVIFSGRAVVAVARGDVRCGASLTAAHLSDAPIPFPRVGATLLRRVGDEQEVIICDQIQR